MKLPTRRLSWIALAALAFGLTGCIVIPSHRHYGPPRAAVIVTPSQGHHHDHGRYGYNHYENRYDDGTGPYRR